MNQSLGVLRITKGMSNELFYSTFKSIDGPSLRKCSTIIVIHL